MKTRILAALGALAVVGATPALAQESRPLNLSVKAGLFFPSSSAARDESSTWFQLGLEYRIQELSLNQAMPDYRAHLTISADWINGGDFRITPVLLNYVGTRNEWFWTAGAGFTFADLGNNDTLFTLALGFGYNFQQGQSPTFIEAKYFHTSEADANGFSVAVGVRF